MRRTVTVIDNVFDTLVEQASTISVFTSTVVCKLQLILVGGPAKRHIELAVSEDLRVQVDAYPT